MHHYGELVNTICHQAEDEDLQLSVKLNYKLTLLMYVWLKRHVQALHRSFNSVLY